MNFKILLSFLIFTLIMMAGCIDPTSNDSFTLSYNANGADSGSVPCNASVAEGNSVTIAGNEGKLVKSGYPFFVGWNTAADGSGDFLRPGDTMKMPGNDQTLYACWVGVSELTASGGKADDKFGFSVDIDGDYAVVGAPGHGTVYVFHRMGTNSWDTGTMLGKGGADSGFGYSVSISGDFLLIGERSAPVRIEGETYPHSNQGKAHIYKKIKSMCIRKAAADGAVISETIIEAPVSSGEIFGRTVSLDGDTLVIGAYSDDYHGTGKVSVYERTEGNTWGTPAVISAPEPTNNQNFGISVALGRRLPRCRGYQV